MRNHKTLLLEMVLDCSFGSGYQSVLYHGHIGSTGSQYTRTVHSGTVRWISQNLSELGGSSAGCPAGTSVDSFNAFVFAVP